MTPRDEDRDALWNKHHVEADHARLVCSWPFWPPHDLSPECLGPVEPPQHVTPRLDDPTPGYDFK